MGKTKKKTLIFLVDDDPMYLKTMENELKQNHNFEVKSFATGEKVLGAVHEKPDVIFLDYFLNTVDSKAMNGLQTLKKIKNEHVSIPVIMLSSQDRIEVAVNCMKHEAFDYIVKSEAAFMRANNAIKNIFRYQDLMKDASFYKATGISTFVIVSLLIASLFVLQIFFPGVIGNYLK